MAARKPKTKTMTTTPTGLLDVGEIQCLFEEMTEWRDNLDGANMSHLPKFEEVSEVCDTMENVVDELESALNEVEELVTKLDVEKIDIEETYTFRLLPKKASRAKRLDLARDENCQGLETLKTRLEEYQGEYEELADTEKKEGHSDDIQELLDKVEEAIDKLGELDDVNFPGMF